MRILLHEFAGYAFVVDLARSLARRGHDVTLAHSPDVPSGKGGLELRPGDPSTLSFRALSLGRPYERYSPVQRLRDEVAYGRMAAAVTAELSPDVVLSSNMPLLAQRAVAASARRADAAFVYWLQDMLGVGIADQLRSRFGAVGGLGGRAFEALEGRLLRSADRVVAISPAFHEPLDTLGVSRGAVEVIENWAPLEETPSLDKRNAWAKEHDLAERTVLLYSGTLGLKHDPSYLVDLAEEFAHDDDVQVVLISEGIGADHVSAATDRVRVLPYQPYERLPEVLATADVLLALLEPSASRFSVPSKVLTYQCAERPILAVMPADNAAAMSLMSTGAGAVVPPGDRTGFLSEARSLVEDEPRRRAMGARARAHASSTFDIEAITSRFEKVLEAAVASRE